MFDIDEFPGVRDAQALAKVFELARSFTGSFHPDDRDAWLNWLDAVQHWKQQRVEQAAIVKVEREEVRRRALEEREAAHQARLEAKAQAQVKKYEERTRAYVARQEAKALASAQATERAQAREERQGAQAKREAREAQKTQVKQQREEARRAEHELVKLQRELRELEPGPRCQLCKEPGHSKQACQFLPENEGEALHDPYPHKPLWQVALERRGSMKPQGGVD